MQITDVTISNSPLIFSLDNPFLHTILNLIYMLVLIHLSISLLALIYNLYLLQKIIKLAKKLSNTELSFHIEQNLWSFLNYYARLMIKKSNNQSYYLMEQKYKSASQLENLLYKKSTLKKLRSEQYLSLSDLHSFLTNFTNNNFPSGKENDYLIIEYKTDNKLPLKEIFL